jgi:hypothetical protein
MIKKVIRPAKYMDYDPLQIKKAITKSNEIHKGGLNTKQIEKVYNTILSTMKA